MMNSGWGMRLVIRFAGLAVALMAVSTFPVPVNYRIALLLSGAVVVMLS
jgi:hypothetical protein